MEPTTPLQGDKTLIKPTATFPDRVNLGFTEKMEFKHRRPCSFNNWDMIVSLKNHFFEWDISPDCCEEQKIQVFHPGSNTPFMDIGRKDPEIKTVLSINCNIYLKNIKERSRLTKPTRHQRETERLYHSLVFGLFDSNTRKLLYVLKFINIHNGCYSKALSFYDKNEHIFKSFI
jgi:hypothetical protein